jgi:hypothetical protein
VGGARTRHEACELIALMLAQTCPPVSFSLGLPSQDTSHLFLSEATMVRPFSATALAAAALVANNQLPTAEAAGKSYQKGHKVELWVSKVRRSERSKREWGTRRARFFKFVFSADLLP